MKGVLKHDFRDLEGVMSLGAIIDGATYVLLPIYLFSIGVDLNEVGFLISISPIIFAISRILFAMISDIKGVKPFLVLNSVANTLKPIIYAFYPTPVGIALGKTIEGIGKGSLWAVARTAAYKFGRKKEESSSTIIGFRYIGLGIGKVGALLLSSLIGIINTFLSLLLVSLLLIRESTDIEEKLKKITKTKVKREIKDLLKIREGKFYFGSVLTGFGYSLLFLMTNLLLIYIYDEILKLDLIGIGLNIGLIYVVAGLLGIKLKKLLKGFPLILLTFLSLAAGTYMVQLGGNLVFISSIFFGIGVGGILRINESIITNISDNKEDVSLSIALINFPSHVMEGILYASAGILTSTLGIFNLMYVIAISILFIQTLGISKIVKQS